MRSAILGLDLGWLCVDEAFSFKALHVLSHGVFAHACGIAYCGVARMALKGFPILAVQEESIYNYLSGRQVKIEDGFGQRKIIAGVISFLGVVVKQWDTSCVE